MRVILRQLIEVIKVKKWEKAGRSIIYLCIIAVFCIIIWIAYQILKPDVYLESYQECKIKLSELSQEECIRFIESRDIKIPESLEGLRNTGALVKNMIWYAEARPWSQMKYDSPEATRLGEMIRRAVNDYYGYDGSPYNFTGGLFVF